MSDNKPNQKRDFKTAVEDAKALATVLAMEAESVFGRRTARVSGVYSKTASDMTPSKIAGLIVGAVVVVFLLQVGYAE
jgi:tetrahydromethanopterin S-methyltransferase subunit F